MPLQVQQVLLPSGNGVECLDFTAKASLIHEKLEYTFTPNDLKYVRCGYDHSN